MVPAGRARRFSVDRRASSPALRGLGAKAILVDADERTTLPFDVLESKLLVPPGRPENVSRTALVNRLRAAGAFPVVLVNAPAGYGKTTLLAQWAERDSRPFAWVTVDERDNDPFVLLKHIAAAVDRIEPLDAGVLEAFDRADDTIWDAVAPRLSAGLSSRTSPSVIVLDGVDALQSTDSLEAIGILIGSPPRGSMIALSGRSLPRVPIASLRVAGPLLELGTYELGLSRREAQIMLRASGVVLDEAEMTELTHRTEGWAAGLQLAAIGSQEESDDAGEPVDLARLTGNDQHIADYLRSEYLSRLTPAGRRFLTRTSVLERMCAPLCNAVLKSKGSALELEAVEQANLFLVRLDHRRRWYRYHHLFRDVLQRELAEHEPDLVPVLHRRAAAWYEAHLDPESALFHAHAAGDVDDAARILSSIALQLHNSGRVSIVEDWLERFDVDDRLDRHPAVAIQGSSIHAARGRAEDADRWLHAAERGVASRRKGVAAVRPRISIMRSALCSEGPVKMQADAELALSRLPKDDAWAPAALLVQGAAALLLGDVDRGDSILEQAIEQAARIGSTETHAIAVGERSLIAAARGNVRAADDLAEEAQRVVEQGELDDYPSSALALAASARSQLRHGQWDRARRRLGAATKLTLHLTYALPWLALQTRLELGDAYVTLRDRAAAQHMLEEARGILVARPALGVLGEAVDDLDSEISAMSQAQKGVSSGLTRAELRLLPMLSTHLSFKEIGGRLHVSRNTIKTQAISVYRKLGVSSRSEAVALAEDLGLLEAAGSLAERLELGDPIASVAH